LEVALGYLAGTALVDSLGRLDDVHPRPRPRFSQSRP
jgi:hypothetical protein